MSELKEQFHEVTEATATARLPNVDIEITHRRSSQGDSEQFLITLQAVPSFEAFGRFLEGANPFTFWAEATKLAWLSWMDIRDAPVELGRVAAAAEIAAAFHRAALILNSSRAPARRCRRARARRETRGEYQLTTRLNTALSSARNTRSSSWPPSTMRPVADTTR